MDNRNGKNQQIFFDALKRNDSYAVLMCIREGIDVNARDKKGWAPIHWVTIFGNMDCLKALIESNANVDIRIFNKEDKDGWTALHLASCFWKQDIAKNLIDAGANINAADEKGITPLHLASREGNLKIIEYLIQHGANPNAKSLFHEEAPLHWAMDSNKIECLQALINAGANVNARNKMKKTPLHFASLKGNLEAVQYLVQNGADVNAKDEDGKTPLHHAALISPGIVEYLIQNKGNWNEADRFGETALHYAVKSNNIVTIRIFVKLGADVNARNIRGDTPLHYAMKWSLNHLFLIENGANPYIANNEGVTPLDMTYDKKLKEEIMAAHANYQNKMAISKIKDTDCDGIGYKITRKLRSI